MFKPEPRDDIKKFISNVNGLADQTRIRKLILQERAPAPMGPNLLTLSKNNDVSYENFCQHVADAAYTRQRAFQERQERKAAHRDDRPARRKSSSRQPTVKKEARVEETYRSGHRGADRARSDKRETRTCFCARRRVTSHATVLIAATLSAYIKELDDEEGQARNDQEVADCSSDSVSHSNSGKE
ncbi:hypothetical protein E4U19_002519 [Claviceps sp. Clav32 group G5]|nr:hypothetical protein E4U19_002519 [Claviceps sp. Clav32 group G5]